MVTALVQFPLPASVSRDKAAELFKGSAPYRSRIICFHSAV